MRLRAAAALVALVLAPAMAMAQDEFDNAVGERIGASAEAAESYQGPLDGAWTVVSTAGRALYAFQLVDKPGGEAPLEGVWRDLRRPPTPGDIGFIDNLTREPQSLAIAFVARPGDPAVTLQLKTDANGFWSGELREGAVVTPVRMQRG